MAYSDAELVERARRGDAAAFDELTERHLDAAYGLALALLGSPDEAEDTVQDAFVRALERLEQCRSPDRFRSWLLQIVRHEALNARRRARVRAALPLEHGNVASNADPARDYERAELRARLTVAVGELTELQRRVVLLHDLEGWSHGDIAELLGISPGGSRVALFKARKALRALLDGQPSHGE